MMGCVMSYEEMLNNYLILYTILNAFCAYLILAIAVRNFLGKGRALIFQTFARLSSYMALVIILDTVIVLGNDRLFRMPNSVMWFLFSLYFLTITLSGQCIYVYFQMILNPQWKWTITMHLKSSIVTFVNIGLLLINIPTKQFFYVENHVFHYGKGAILEFLISYGYIAVVAMYLLFEANQPENEYRSKMMHRMILFSSIPAIAGVTQVLSGGYYPVLSIGYAISMAGIYMDSLENSISKDAMTGLNNKGELLKEVNRRLMHRKENVALYLFMMDIDRFKRINDTYGHQEGDQALIHFSEALVNAVKKISYNSFLARFGGDEFLMLVETPKEGTWEMEQREIPEVKMVLDAIQESLEEVNDKYQTPYRIATSIGVSRLTDEVHTVQGFMSLADEDLYKQKRIAHSKERLRR
jgi:diguanylate cyclase (GGDEF)-like protein